jgi:hypothetical protein
MDIFLVKFRKRSLAPGTPFDPIKTLRHIRIRRHYFNLMAFTNRPK